MAIPGWGTLVGALADILDKLIPGRRERLRDQITQLEQEMAKALAANDAVKVAQITKQLEDLRRKIGDVQ